MIRDSVSVKLRWALSSGTPGCLRPSASACSAAACASASSATMASRIFSNRRSRKANSSGNSSPRLSLPYRRSSSSSAAWACRNNSATSAANCAAFLLHPLELIALCFDALALTFVPSSATCPSFTSPACWHNASTCTNRPDSASRLSLRKSEMVRKSGVLFAANTLKAMSSWRRWAMPA